MMAQISFFQTNMCTAFRKRNHYKFNPCNDVVLVSDETSST